MSNMGPVPQIIPQDSAKVICALILSDAKTPCQKNGIPLRSFVCKYHVPVMHNTQILEFWVDTEVRDTDTNCRWVWSAHQRCPARLLNHVKIRSSMPQWRLLCWALTASCADVPTSFSRVRNGCFHLWWPWSSALDVFWRMRKWVTVFLFQDNVD